MDPIISMLSDLLASAGYLLAFIVCAAWFAISIIHAASRRHMLRWLALALAMASAASSFFLMSIYTGWRAIPYTNTIAMTRVGFAMAALAGAVFTILYLATMWRKGIRREPNE